MNVQTTENNICISANGIELLKLKAAIAKCIGDVATYTRTGVSFPAACLDVVTSNIPGLAALFPARPTSFDLHIEARKSALSALAEHNVSQISGMWERILDIPQQYAVEAMVTPNLLGLCLFDEQGSGKTVMALAAFDILKERSVVDSMIIVCPKSMLSGWDSDLRKFLNDKYTCVIAKGSHSQKRTLALSGFDVLISNYEGLDATLVTLNAIASKKRFLLVVDESYYAKNKETERSASVTKLRAACSRCFVLCGTPAPNSPYDLVNQFNIADAGFTFATFSPTNNLNIDKIAIADLIATRGTFIRRLKNEILASVPEKCFHVVSVKLSGRQKEIYEKARHQLELELRAYDNTRFKRNLASYFQKRAALLQICSIPTNIDPAFSETPAKYLQLDKLLGDLFAQKRKVIIWTSYRASIDDLAARYVQYAPLIIDGNATIDERRAAVDEFQNDEGKLLFIANPSAAGAGITLHASHDAIYISYTNQAAHYLQSLDRIHRRGQISDKVNYYLFICENTIEESEVLRLRARELQQHELLGDTIAWPTSLDDALAELSQGAAGR